MKYVTSNFLPLKLQAVFLFYIHFMIILFQCTQTPTFIINFYVMFLYFLSISNPKNVFLFSGLN